MFMVGDIQTWNMFFDSEGCLAVRGARMVEFIEVA